jgi:anthranilate synthase/aminodeoxychorismate synthase-like glutamine amidotransferase
MILLIDNYDSFVHNIARYVRELGYSTQIIRNDRANSAEILALQPEAIIISPGPCGPDRAGISTELVHDALERHIPLLGICLGHQVIAAAFGDKIRRAKHPIHGKASRIHHNNDPLFVGISNPFAAARYHSLVAELKKESMLKSIAHADDGELMALRYLGELIYGVQFHPESVLTEHGHALLKNFLTLASTARKVSVANISKGR